MVDLCQLPLVGSLNHFNLVPQILVLLLQLPHLLGPLLIDFSPLARELGPSLRLLLQNSNPLP
jgi:hypothetical protein